MRSAGPPPAAPAPLHLSAVDLGAQTRIDTGLGEFNRVLGGGLVAGSVVLVGGEPGVGKSTLLLQALLSMETRGVSTLLISGEESPAQVKLRSARLGGTRPGIGDLRLLTETQTESVVAALEHLKPEVCVVDSVQTLWSAEVAEQGLVEVPDPSSIFLEEGDLRSGSAVVPVLEGTRCLLAEVQALVSPSNLAMPQRVARGVDRNRLAMIVAVLSRRARLPLLKCDIFVNVAGGLVLEDPAADLAVALAIASAWRDGSGGQGVAAFGEVSLTGKIRYVLQGEKRVQELARRGFPRILIPGRNAEELSGSGGWAPGAELVAVTDIEHAVTQVVKNTATRSTSG
jgi:predicted ATP-dependent serine protease